MEWTVEPRHRSDVRRIMRMTPIAIVSGGQTGVDRAALDTAAAWRWPGRGWCPAGRRAEDGPISHRYALKETPLPDYIQRTRWNVRDSDGTLILGSAADSPGTSATIAATCEFGKPIMQVAWDHRDAARAIADWMRKYNIRTLNVAGPRESEVPGAYQRTQAILNALFAHLSCYGSTK